MYHVTLPTKIGAGENKDKPNLVEITSAKITTVDDGGKKVGIKYGNATYTDSEGKLHTGIPADLFQYPQFGPEPTKNDKGEYLELTEDQAKEALDEMIKDAGGVVRLVENYNDATRTASLNKGKNYIRTKEEGDPEKIVTEGLRLTREFSWAQADRITNKSVRENAEKLAEEIDELPPEEIKKRLMAMLGKA